MVMNLVGPMVDYSVLSLERHLVEVKGVQKVDWKGLQKVDWMADQMVASWDANWVAPKGMTLVALLVDLKDDQLVVMRVPSKVVMTAVESAGQSDS